MDTNVLDLTRQPRGESPCLEFRAGQSVAVRSRFLAQDVAEGVRLWRLALTLGWLDIKLRYRGSLLGPFWLTLSTGAMVGALGVLYATLWKINVREYLPFLALSQVLWGFLASIINDGCVAFTSVEAVIRSVRMPYFVHSMRSLVRNALILAHNVLVIVVVYAVLAVWPGEHMLLALPGLVVWTVDGLAVAMLLGAICARFRDIPPIIGSLLQIAFFITPVIWQPKQLGAGNNWMLLGNPFFDLLEIVRAPLLGTTAGWHVWVAALVFSAAACGVSWVFVSHARARIAFWV